MCFTTRSSEAILLRKITTLVEGWQTLFTGPYTFKFRTRWLTGTASGMASDSVRGRD